MPSEIVCRYDPRKQIGAITQVRVDQVPETLPFSRQPRIDSNPSVRFPTETDNVALAKSDFLDPVFRQETMSVEYPTFWTFRASINCVTCGPSIQNIREMQDIDLDSHVNGIYTHL